MRNKQNEIINTSFRNLRVSITSLDFEFLIRVYILSLDFAFRIRVSIFSFAVEFRFRVSNSSFEFYACSRFKV